jgi:putative transposase
MRRSKFTDEQILAIVKEGEAGRKVADLCRANGITEQTYYRWKAKYGGMELSELQRLKQVEDENRRLKHIVAEQTLDIQALKAVVAKKCMVRPRSASETPVLRVSPRQCIRPVGGACPLAGHDG